MSILAWIVLGLIAELIGSKLVNKTYWELLALLSAVIYSVLLEHMELRA